MYPNVTKPFIDYTNAQIESLTRFAQSRDITQLTRSSIENFWQLVQEHQSRFVHSDALKELTKANFENFSRLAQDYSRSFSALAFETQGQLTRGIQEGTRRMQAVANTTSNLVRTAAVETAETVNDSAEEISEETDVAKARAAKRRG
jgi:hypothetical protein